MLPVRTTSPEGEPQEADGTNVAAPPSDDIDALEAAAMRLRPSWESAQADAPAVSPPPDAPDVAPVSAPRVHVPAHGPAAARVAAVDALAAEPAPAPVRSAARATPPVDVGASIIVNEPGVIVLDAPPPEIVAARAAGHAVPTEPSIPQVSIANDMLSGGPAVEAAPNSFASAALPDADDDEAFAPPLTSRRPWLWAAGGAALGLVALMVFLGRDDAPAAHLAPTAAAKANVVAEPAPAAAPEPVVTPAPVVTAPAPEAEAPAPEPSPDEPALADEPSAAPATETHAVHKVRRPKAAPAASSATSIVRAAARPSPARAPVQAAPKPAAVAAKKPRKGAGFVSTNPYQ